MSEKHCLICYSGGGGEASSIAEFPLKEVKVQEDSFLSKHLKTVFILRKLLNVPASFLERYLKMSNGEQHPDSWKIWFCDDCDKMVEKAWETFEEIVKASQKFKVVQEQIIGKIRDSFEQVRDEETVRKVDAEQAAELVTQESREFVRKHNFEDIRDPFILGDLEARQLLEKRKLVGMESATETFGVKEEIEEIGSPWTEHFINEDTNQSEPEHFMEDSLPSSNDKTFMKSKNTRKTKTKKSSTKSKPRQPLKYPTNSDEDAFRGPDGLLKFRCQFTDCGKVYNERQRRSYEAHKLKHLNVEFPCDQCDKVLGSLTTLHKHKRIIHQGKRRNRPKNIPEHVKAEQRRQYKIKYQQQCPHCDFKSTKWLVQHHVIAIHQKIFPIYCELCGKGYRHKRDLKIHQAEVHSLCSECKMTFENKENLRQHQLQVHGKEIDVKSCEECGKTFVMLSSLRRHQQLHEHEKRIKEGGGDNVKGSFICDLCGKDFKMRGGLNNHKWAVHTVKGKSRKKKRTETIIDGVIIKKSKSYYPNDQLPMSN